MQCDVQGCVGLLQLSLATHSLAAAAKRQNEKQKSERIPLFTLQLIANYGVLIRRSVNSI